MNHSSHSAAPEKSAGCSRLDTWLLWALVLAYQIPVWWFDFIPTTDGPAHLYNAELLRQLVSSASVAMGDYFVLNAHPDPTWFMHVLLTGLLFVVSPALLLKLIISGYVLLLPLGLRYAIRGVSKQSDYLALLAFPFIYGYTFHVGMFSFSYAVVSGFFLLGYWLRCAAGQSGGQLLALFSLALLTYALHVVVFGVVLLVITILAVSEIFTDWRLGMANSNRAWVTLWRVGWQRGVRVALAFLPVVILAAAFLLSRETYSFLENPPLTRLLHFAALTALVSFENREVIFSAGLSLLIFVLCATVLVQRWRDNTGLFSYDALLLACVACVLMLLFIPETMLISDNGMAGGSYLQKRIQPYPVYVILLWLAAQNLGRYAYNTARVGAVIIAGGLLTLHSFKYAEINQDIAEYLSVGSHIEAGSAVLPIHLRRGGVATDGAPVSDYVNVYWHLSNILGFSRHLLILDNFEATMGYFPLIFRSDRMPYLPPVKIEGEKALLSIGPPNVEVLPLIQKLGLQPEYVLVWLGRESGWGDSEYLYEWLRTNYKKIYVSDGRHFVELYRRLP